MAFSLNNPYFLSLLSGLFLWLSFPAGGGVTPVLAVALIPLFQAIAQVDVKKSVFCGLITGSLHYCALMYWIVIVVGKYGGLPWFISLQALVLLTLYMSAYLVVFSLVARSFLLSLPGVVSLLLIPALWVGLDWFRGVFLTGLPWMDLGYALYKMPRLIQIADVVGHHGLSFIIVFTNVFIFLFLKSQKGIKYYALLVLPALCLYGGVGYYSFERFQEIQRIVALNDLTTVRIGVVQGNMDQSEKWSLSKQQETVDKYVTLSQSLVKGDKPFLVVWPETALPFYPPSNEQMQPLRQMVSSSSMNLLTGAPWYEIIDRAAQKVNFYNSALLLTAAGDIEDTYFKNHLVPFGEYVPFKELVPFLSPLVEAVGDFSPGEIEKPIQWEQAQIGVLICFESVFPELSRKWVKAGANVLVNLTNDAWYGMSSAPHQSLGMAVLRAVETRRSLVRSANTGFSAFVSPSGEVVKQSPLFKSWAEIDDVPLLNNITFWVQYGYLFGPICLIITLMSIGCVVIRKRWT